ncbi:Extracellular calcium-sensing receptor [Merluccius polli]|uniref:Extracellular calcium-sensing receptor n=1 Tax=Merluccius polli TaxID=89951 RepID=A0AA47MJD7_MERPO|nr:Extracellular calcium-sensing receptor [Merluccius polli]
MRMSACSMDTRELRFARAMSFAIEEINGSADLLPGVALGYKIHDSCSSAPMAVQVAFQFTNDPQSYSNKNNNNNSSKVCSQSGRVLAVIGDSGSTQSIIISRIIGPFDIPQVSHFSTCACLSDKSQYPTFFRTIPSDHFQANALAKLVKNFGWTWIGALRADTDYGNEGMASFLLAAHKEGICVEYSESFTRNDPQSKIQQVADVIRRSTAMVVVAFGAPGDIRVVLEELTRHPSPPRQWIGSEAWVTDPELLRFQLCAGTIGFAIPKSIIPGFREYVMDLSPAKVAASHVLSEFWEGAFNCRLEKNTPLSLFVEAGSSDRVCDGTEDIQKLQNPYTDTSQLRNSNMVYKAAYAIAHAIHNLVCKKINSTIHCDQFMKIEPVQVFDQLKRVNFSRNGYHVLFDANGDPVAFYELINWQKNQNGGLEVVTVGHYDESLPPGQKFNIRKKIRWPDGGIQAGRTTLFNSFHTTVPVSVCSDSCPPGTRKVLHKGKPICCYDCVPCAEGEISNTSDSSDCLPCPKEFWPNEEKNLCLPKPVEFLSFHEVLGIILATFSIAGACLTIITAVVFFQHRFTPIVRANNSELSFLLLFSLTLCFLCSLTFIGRPSDWSCMLRHTAFGITFVLCISCVLGKTLVVLMAFKATLPDNLLQRHGPVGPETSGKVGIRDVSDAGNATDSVKCMLRGTPRPAAFTLDGDYLIGGVFSIHYNMKTVKNNYTSLPEPRECTGR